MFDSFQTLPACQHTRKGETGEVLRIFISISPLPGIADSRNSSVYDCPGCCSTQAWEELLGSHAAPVLCLF